MFLFHFYVQFSSCFYVCNSFVCGQGKTDSGACGTIRIQRECVLCILVFGHRTRACVDRFSQSWQWLWWYWPVRGGCDDNKNVVMKWLLDLLYMRVSVCSLYVCRMELLGFSGWVKAIEPFFVWQGSVYNNCGFSYENLSTPIKIIYLSVVYGNSNHLSRRHYIPKNIHTERMKSEMVSLIKGKLKYTHLFWLEEGGWEAKDIPSLNIFQCFIAY